MVVTTVGVFQLMFNIGMPTFRTNFPYQVHTLIMKPKSPSYIVDGGRMAGIEQF
jgi:hypothetical protein